MGTVRVLVADDHAIVRSGIRNALQDLPEIEVIGEVGDGPSLLAFLDRSLPDLLVIDVTMPEFEPVGTIRQIRAHFPRHAHPGRQRL
jgi:DNA-binding NarL/FixJ family response regulator